jgi:glycosyltransferase involved in cell wall biosynthesis
MKNKYKVSVVIPTYNSEKTIAKCLKSVKLQSYRNTEIIVVDSYSKDRTVEISKTFGVQVIQTQWKLLGSRFIGLTKSKGSLILMLDSDQILKNRNTITHAVKMMKKFDMLVFEEFTYRPHTWIQELFVADRELVHKLSDIHLDPSSGVLLPRMYKKKILEKAFRNIPKVLIPVVIAYDHAMIYFEAFKISNSIGILKNAVWHNEPISLTELWNKNYRYGVNTKEFSKINSSYQKLLKDKVRFRKGAFNSGNIIQGIQTYLLIILKGIPYKIGYWRTKK